MAEPPLIDDSWYIRPPRVRTRRSAGGVVVRRENDQIFVALARENKWPLFVLPKGGIEKGEHAEAAARREIAEEVGITQLKFLADLGKLGRCGWNKRVWIITHFFLYSTKQIEGKPLDENRHFGVWWHPINDLPEMLWPDQKKLIESNRERIENLLKDS
ncbi:MAG TPA: NUDIX domain-containing protein [Abditibacteriaceae bacterium]|jgi:8-oxo-dGTP pyrophosphatase MutT (NUDIX family)